MQPARFAGVLYLLMALFAPFGLIYVPHALIVRGNATATADNILHSELLFRTGIASRLVTATLFIFVALALYRLLSDVNRLQAALMVVLALVSVPVSLFNAAIDMAVLTLLHAPDFLAVFDKRQIEAFALLLLGIHRNGTVVAEIFWGLWLFPFGALVIRSRFIPRILGVLLIVNGFAYLAVSAAAVMAPDLLAMVNRITFVAMFGELWMVLWLLIRGGGAQPQLQPTLSRG